MNTTQTPSFHSLGINPQFVEALDKLKFKIPTPIQHQAIPLAIDGKDLIGIAQTGTGKTLAFGIPMIQKLMNRRGTGLILVPTRELGMQVEEALLKVGRQFGIRTALLIGGASMYNQITALKKNPQIIIATPGRIIDHLQQRTVMLFDVCMLVLDEADRMLDMGFAPQIEKVLKTVPKDRQTLLFSATMPPHIVKLAAAYMNLPISVEIAKQGTAADNVSQEIYIVRKDMKKALLEKLLCQYKGTVLIFTRTKITARILTRQLYSRGFTVAEIHSDRSLNQRREALQGFKSGKYRILVATDIASRGIDVTNIELVLNYDLPEETENYVHRIGRTARAGKSGHAISLATPDQRRDVKEIEKLIRKELPVASHPEVPTEQFEAGTFAYESKKGFGGNRRFGRPGGNRRFSRGGRR